MSFVASPIVPASGPLPTATHLAANAPSFTLCSHIRIVGAGTVTFNTGQVLTSVAGADNVFAIPVTATSLVIGGGTPSVQYGKMD